MSVKSLYGNKYQSNSKQRNRKGTFKVSEILNDPYYEDPYMNNASLKIPSKKDITLVKKKKVGPFHLNIKPNLEYDGSKNGFRLSNHQFHQSSKNLGKEKAIILPGYG